MCERDREIEAENDYSLLTTKNFYLILSNLLLKEDFIFQETISYTYQ